MKPITILVAVLAVLAVGGGIWWYMLDTPPQTKPRPVQVPDTVTVKKPYRPPVVETPEQPRVVYVYVKPDTALRDTAEKRDIITGVKVKPGDLLEIQTINPQGFVTAREFDISDVRLVTVDGTGNVETKPKRKFWKKVAVIGGVAVGVGVTAFILLH